MKYLKSYNEAIRDSDGLSYADKVKILESCYPISTQSITDICQNILDDYDSDHIHIQDSVYYTNNKKMSGVSSGYMAMENFIEGWRTDRSSAHHNLFEDEDFDTIWNKYLEPTSKIGTMISLVFHNMGYQSTDEYPKINDLERELKKITRKIEAEVGVGDVEFMFDWAYPGINRHGELDSLRAENKYVTDYTLFISYPKKKLSKYNESNTEVAPEDIERVLDLELEQHNNFSVVNYDIIPLESYKYPDKVTYNVLISFDFSNTEFLPQFDWLRSHGFQANHDSDLAKLFSINKNNLMLEIDDIIKPILQKLSRKYDFEIVEWKPNLAYRECPWTHLDYHDPETEAAYVSWFEVELHMILNDPNNFT